MVRNDDKASWQHCGASETVWAHNPLLLACAEAECLRQDSDKDTSSDDVGADEAVLLLLMLLCCDRLPGSGDDETRVTIDSGGICWGCRPRLRRRLLLRLMTEQQLQTRCLQRDSLLARRNRGQNDLWQCLTADLRRCCWSYSNLAVQLSS